MSDNYKAICFIGKNKCEKAQGGLGLEHPEKTLFRTCRMCQIPDIPSLNL